MITRAASLVEIAIQAEAADGPMADALRALARSGAGGGVGYDAIFRPGIPSSGNAFATEAEVFEAIANVDLPRVGIDLVNTPNPGTAYVVTQSWDLKGGALFSIYANTDTFKLQFDEPHQLLNTQSVQNGLGVHFRRTLTPGIAYPLFPDSIPHIFAIVGGSVAFTEGTFPVIDLIGQTQVVSLLVGAVRKTGAAPFVRGDATSNAFAVNLASSGSLGQSFDNDWVAGPGGMNLAYVGCDASFLQPTVAGFFGTFNGVFRIDHASGVLYNGAADPPPTWALVPGPPTTVAEAISRIAVAVAGGAAGPIA